MSDLMCMRIGHLMGDWDKPDYTGGVLAQKRECIGCRMVECREVTITRLRDENQ